MKLKTGVVFLLAGTFIVVTGPLFGQNTRTVKEKKIASQTVYEYFVEEGMDEPVIESLERYNENGDLIEIKEFNSKSELKRWEKYVYNNEGKLVEEVFLDSKGKVDYLFRWIESRKAVLQQQG
jgi:hypothetical protein